MKSTKALQLQIEEEIDDAAMSAFIVHFYTMQKR